MTTLTRRTAAVSLAMAVVVTMGPIGSAFAEDSEMHGVGPSPHSVSASASSSPTSEPSEVPEPEGSLAPHPTASTTAAKSAGNADPEVATDPTAVTIESKSMRRIKAKQRKIAKARVVWGFAALGQGGEVRGGRVSVRSIRNKPIKANVLTKTTNKRGFYAVSRLGLPKRFVIVIAGGKMRVRNGSRMVWRNTKGSLLTAVGVLKSGFARHSAVDATIGTTVAALTGIKKYRNASDVRAAKRTRKALRLPGHAKLGTYDRLLPHYVTAKKLRAKSNAQGGLAKLTNTFVRVASRNARMAGTLGEGSRVRFRLKRESGQSDSGTNRVGTRSVSVAVAGELGEAALFASDTYQVASAGYGIYNQVLGILGVGGESTGSQLAEIQVQLTQISDQLSTIQTQLTTLQDETQSQFAALSLQVSQSRYDVLAASGKSIGAQANYAMQQMQYLANISTPALSFLLPGQLAEVNGLLSNLSNSSASAALQRDLIGGDSSSPALLGSLWNLIGQQRATEAPATASASRAVTRLLTHETYDAFTPAAAQWYLAQVQLSILQTNYTMKIDLGDSAPLIQNAGQFELSPTAQAIYNYSMNGNCNESPSPCPGTFNSYLDALVRSLPSKTVGALSALDTSTGLMWGNFGTVNWNTPATKPTSGDAELNRAPTASVTCGTENRVLELDTDFFATVNGTDDGCQWPGAPVGGPAGSTESASDWEMLTTDPGSEGAFNATLGDDLTANMNNSGTGLLAQFDNSKTIQNANPTANIPGVNAADFTSPSVFPNTGWGRLVYSKGAWKQFAWESSVPTFDFGEVNYPLFQWHEVTTPRDPAGDFFAFDILNPTQPSLSGTNFATNCTIDSYTQDAARHCTDWIMPSIVGKVPWADTYKDGGAGYHEGATYERDTGLVNDGQTNPEPLTVGGFAAPWWPLANLSRDGDLNSSLPATPGCANYEAHGTYGHDEVASINIYQTCSASVIGIREVTVSDYEWQQPQSIG